MVLFANPYDRSIIINYHDDVYYDQPPLDSQAIKSDLHRLTLISNKNINKDHILFVADRLPPPCTIQLKMAGEA